MKNFLLLTDSTADLSKDIRDMYDIDYVSMNYVIDGVEYPASLDWEYHSYKDFYNMMRKGKRILTTQVTRDTYIKKFESALKNGKDVLYISCSSALSGSVNLAKLIAKELASVYTDNHVYCVDSLLSSLGQGYMVITASKLRDNGKSAKEVAEYIESIKLKVNQFGTVESLEYLRRAGRVKASSAFFGNMFGIKPIIISDITGQNLAIEKVKGANNSKIRIAQHIADVVEEEGKECLYISHADCIEDAELLKEKILELTSFKNVIIGTIGPIVGSCVGPGTIISFCYGKEVTAGGNN